MYTSEERLALLEGRVQEFGEMVTGIRSGLAGLEARMDGRFTSLESRMDARFAQAEARVDARFSQLETRLDAGFSQLETRLDDRFSQFESRIDARFAQADARLDRRFEQVDVRFREMDAKMSRQFFWLVGLQVTGLVATLGVLGAVVAAVVGR